MAETYLTPNATLPYCKGCGHGQVLRALGEALTRLQLPPQEVVIVTDIGCVGLADAQFSTPHTVHTTHGRSTAFAAGIALADGTLGAGRLKPIVMIGDGGAMIGLNHLVNSALVNPDMTVLVHNNFLFGMTGGQNSAFSPAGFVTSTTPGGNATPPLDLAALLMAARAPFVARKLATDRDLAETIARAITHPGFAVVEVLELCTAYATRWNTITGAQLKSIADAAGYELGILREEPRPIFAATYKQRVADTAALRSVASEFTSPLDRPMGLVLAGTAGERVQSAASLLASAGMRAGLHATQKNDNPVTQGTGFSVSELILSPEEILFTGIEKPDALLIVSEDGARELERNQVFADVDETTLVLSDLQIALPDLPCRVLRFPFRRVAGPKLAATAAVATWLNITRAIPLEAFWAALEARFGAQAEATKTMLRSLLEKGCVAQPSETPHATQGLPPEAIVTAQT
jgi:pyruvate/2-oxoacid:ferredoxin oxidoreductase beta subunit/Pyruvate/2-oxoacid:ferredoxin oxidoreductase gamma subunit